MVAIDLWTDGANSGPGMRGGWACLICPQPTGTRLALSGYEAATTSNRMELMAVIEGLQALGTGRAQVTVFTDSAYVKNPMVRGWTARWRYNGWKNAEGKAVANQDLWERLLALTAQHAVRWEKVRGHSTWALNNLVDEMAVRAKIAGQGETLIL